MLSDEELEVLRRTLDLHPKDGLPRKNTLTVDMDDDALHRHVLALELRGLMVNAGLLGATNYRRYRVTPRGIHRVCPQYGRTQ